LNVLTEDDDNPSSVERVECEEDGHYSKRGRQVSGISGVVQCEEAVAVVQPRPLP